MKRVILLMVALPVALLLVNPDATVLNADPHESLAIAPLIAAAIISAAAAAASGIAGAAGQGAAADAQAKESAASRKLQEKLLKMQLAQQGQQFNQNYAMQAQQALGSTYQDQANVGLDRAAERQKSRANLLSALGRMMQ